MLSLCPLFQQDQLKKEKKQEKKPVNKIMNQLSLLPLQTDTFINMYKYTFDPFTSTISLLILLTVCYTILMT